MANERQASALAPAQPAYILRGHTSQIHSVQFVRQNRRLLTGDADGWVVYWRLESKRPLAVWRAHDATILGTAEWPSDRLITHGRDNTLRIWQLRATDEDVFSTVLPADGASLHRPKPWLLHTLPVNTLNFCAFSMCPEQYAFDQRRRPGPTPDRDAALARVSDSIIVAVPARDDKKIEVYQFPDEKLVSVVPRVESKDTGMVMAVKLAHHNPSNAAMVIAGYEGGFTAVYLLRPQRTAKSIPDFAQLIYLSQPHAQPILSLDASPDAKTYFTSAADALISAHRIPELPLNIQADSTTPMGADRLLAPAGGPKELESSGGPITRDEPSQTVDTGSAARGKKSNQPDEPAGAVPPSTSPSTSPVGLGDTAAEPPPLSFSKQPVAQGSSNSNSSFTKPAGLSALLSSAAPPSKVKPATPASSSVQVQPPYKMAQTRHAGQQSLRIRSDGRLLVTGGWDSRVRIYSSKTLKEVAVLKWHKEGVYAVDFGCILDPASVGEHSRQKSADLPPEAGDGRVAPREHGLGRLQRQREERMQLKHWVAAGAKDGKISLWEVF
ncbi:WD40 repeat-like protein [Corynespora cassiicola Philippines]|uniref:ASTRA-associated protein 1 n=1 Tax=Corynespora cassiicola Philippines TaxID=1448308 RepID=A0A2T2N8V0_CORCC|nr:WD40 repeat-like protein [Corynespora cassiicola Philippines]